MSTTLFEAHENAAVLARIDALDGGGKPIWGKMNATEMCDHCARPMEVAVGERELDGPWFLKLFGRLMKKGVVGPPPFKKNLPTAKSFIPTSTITCGSSGSENGPESRSGRGLAAIPRIPGEHSARFGRDRRAMDGVSWGIPRGPPGR